MRWRPLGVSSAISFALALPLSPNTSNRSRQIMGKPWRGAAVFTHRNTFCAPGCMIWSCVLTFMLRPSSVCTVNSVPHRASDKLTRLWKTRSSPSRLQERDHVCQQAAQKLVHTVHVALQDPSDNLLNVSSCWHAAVAQQHWRLLPA
jgi:hypothetical protein